MKKCIILSIISLGLINNVSAITISLDQTNANYEPIISFYLSRDDYEANKNPIHQDSINTSLQNINQDHFNKSGHLSENTKKALQKAAKLFITIEFSLPKEPKSKMMLYCDYVGLNDAIKVVVAPFGENQAVGAVAINKTRYEPKGPKNDSDYFYDLVKNILPKKS